jgi:prevent-host-death family protein
MPDIQWHSGADREVSVRDLRNRTSEVLRRVEAGETVTVTVDRRPAARLVPLSRRGRPESMPASEFFARLAELGGGADPALRDELREMLTDTTDDVKIE